MTETSNETVVREYAAAPTVTAVAMARRSVTPTVIRVARRARERRRGDCSEGLGVERYCGRVMPLSFTGRDQEGPRGAVGPKILL